ncbi:unnamed protein product [Closterium sp. Naga37s-1]|nr:unnamed protein product [Closterium sp. Naga37s-1]
MPHDPDGPDVAPNLVGSSRLHPSTCQSTRAAECSIFDFLVNEAEAGEEACGANGSLGMSFESRGREEDGGWGAALAGMAQTPPPFSPLRIPLLSLSHTLPPVSQPPYSPLSHSPSLNCSSPSPPPPPPFQTLPPPSPSSPSLPSVLAPCLAGQRFLEGGHSFLEASHACSSRTASLRTRARALSDAGGRVGGEGEEEAERGEGEEERCRRSHAKAGEKRSSCSGRVGEEGQWEAWMGGGKKGT